MNLFFSYSHFTLQMLVFVAVLWACAAGRSSAMVREPRYACPVESWCVPSDYCEEKLIVHRFTASDDELKPLKVT